jgi:hypothetical protein
MDEADLVFSAQKKKNFSKFSSERKFSSEISLYKESFLYVPTKELVEDRRPMNPLKEENR